MADDSPKRGTSMGNIHARKMNSSETGAYTMKTK